MHGRGGDHEITLDVRFGRGSLVHLGVIVDEREVLTLLLGSSFPVTLHSLIALPSSHPKPMTTEHYAASR